MAGMSETMHDESCKQRFNQLLPLERPPSEESEMVLGQHADLLILDKVETDDVSALALPDEEDIEVLFPPIFPVSLIPRTTVQEDSKGGCTLNDVVANIRKETLEARELNTQECSTRKR